MNKSLIRFQKARLSTPQFTERLQFNIKSTTIETHTHTNSSTDPLRESKNYTDEKDLKHIELNHVHQIDFDQPPINHNSHQILIFQSK